MKMKLHAKDDGLWLELKTEGKKKNRVALINLGAKNPHSSTLVEGVINEVWNELILEQRKEQITSLSDYALTEKLTALARNFYHETRWMIEEAGQRWGEDLDEEEEDD